MADRLASYTEKCTISFIDFYRKIQKNVSSLGISKPSESQMIDLMGTFSEIAKDHGIYLDTCAEEIDLSMLGIGHASCIDIERLQRIGNYRLNLPQDKNQRPACGCAASVDIGGYNTCQNGCVYCYANHSEAIVNRCRNTHDPKSPLLNGTLSPEDKITLRPAESNIVTQIALFV